MAATTRDTAFDGWLAHNQSQKKLHFGVSFSSLNVFGFTSSVRLQPTVVSFGLALPRFLARLVSRSAHSKVQILQDVNGLVRSGEMLLVLGRPSSGCTTFLKTLAGDTHGVHIGGEAEVNYEGVSYRQMHSDFKGESIYLAEIDVHFPELTVGQTLGFAASVHESHESGSERGSISEKMARDVAALFRLENAFNTWMGNSMITGVSGGEKRRASIAEALTGGAQLQFWDNSTRGLDSSTALNFINLLRDCANQVQSTVVMSIYQASETMYEKFDKVTVLYEGRQIYFGPVQEACHYFTELGFARPARATTPDFLTSLTNPAERIIRQGFEDKVPRSPDEFAAAWRRSEKAIQLGAHIKSFNLDHPTLGQDSQTKPEQASILKL